MSAARIVGKQRGNFCISASKIKGDKVSPLFSTNTAAIVATAKKRSLLVHGSPANIAEPRSFQLDARKTDPKLELMRQRDSLAFMKHNHTSQETTTATTAASCKDQACATCA